MKKKFQIGCTIAALLFYSTKGFSGQNIGFDLSDAFANNLEENQLLVRAVDVETNQPVIGADIFVDSNWNESVNEGSLWRDPLKTDRQGLAQAKAPVSSQRAVTIKHPDFVTQTVVGVQTKSITFYLDKKKSASNTLELSGQTSGWELPESGFFGAKQVAAGLVFQTLSPSTLIYFDADKIISPLKDNVEIHGTRQIPSNLVLPEQDISVFFTSVHLNKPAYRLPVQEGTPSHLCMIQGEIAVNSLTETFMNGQKLDATLLNQVRVKKMGLGRATIPTANGSENLTANLYLEPKLQLKIDQAPFSANVYVATATDLDGNGRDFAPTDIKLAYSLQKPLNGNVVLATPKTGNKNSISVAIAASEHNKLLSGVIAQKPVNGTQIGGFLTPDATPDMETLAEKLTINPVSGGISTLNIEGEDQKLGPIWKIAVLPSAGETQFPATSALGDSYKGRLAFFNLLFQSPIDEKHFDGTTALSKLERFTRSTALIGKSESRNLDSPFASILSSLL